MTMSAPGVTKLSKNRASDTLRGSLRLAVGLAGRRAISTDQSAQEIASVDAVILHAAIFEYIMRLIVLGIRVYTIQ
jgi:hypothetical protein